MARTASAERRVLERAAGRIVAKSRRRIEKWSASNPTPPRPRVRRRPDEYNVWTRYCHSMITTQQPINDAFWTQLGRDPRWRELNSCEGSPTVTSIEVLLRDCDVRYPGKKARCLMKAWHFDHQFAEIAGLMQDALWSVHDADRSVQLRREVELLIAVRIQTILAGCNMGPKVARLMLTWDSDSDHRYGTDFYNVIPLDSRWQRELSNQGVRLDPRVLTSELAYREVEQALCDACFAAGIMPALLDGAVFGVF